MWELSSIQRRSLFRRVVPTGAQLVDGKEVQMSAPISRTVPHASLVLIIMLLLGISIQLSEAHQDPWHQRPSCPSDHGSYVCGDRGHCDQCPDNAYAEMRALPSKDEAREKWLYRNAARLFTGSSVRIGQGGHHGQENRKRDVDAQGPRTPISSDESVV